MKVTIEVEDAVATKLIGLYRESYPSEFQRTDYEILVAAVTAFFERGLAQKIVECENLDSGR